MPHVNEQVDEKGVAFTQGDAVSAFFPHGSDELGITHRLIEAGIPENRVYLFVGRAGAERLNARPNDPNQSIWDRFWRAFERSTADENFVMEKADAMLRAGGTLVVVFTDGDLERKAKTIGVLKDHGGEHVVHWGEWTFEEIG